MAAGWLRRLTLNSEFSGFNEKTTQPLRRPKKRSSASSRTNASEGLRGAGSIPAPSNPLAFIGAPRLRARARGPSITGTPRECRPGRWRDPGRPDTPHRSHTRQRCIAPRGTPRRLSYCTGCHSCSPRSMRHSHNGHVDHRARSYTRDPRCIRRARRSPLRRHGVADSSHGSCTKPCTPPRYSAPPRRDSPRGPGTPRTGSPRNTVTRVRSIPRPPCSPVPCPRIAHLRMRDCTDKACDRPHSPLDWPYRQLRRHHSPRRGRNRHNIRHRSHTRPGNSPCQSHSGVGCLERTSR